jgi:hypothetical protein
MALLGGAALAMWWDMAPDMREEFEHWHSHEHFRERLSLPGFLRGSRWGSADGGEGFFILYEVTEFGALTSPEYLARLNAPTPWSTKLMPHHRNMVRSLCRVVHSHGAGVAGHAITMRLTHPANALDALVREAPLRPGVAGAHLLEAQEPRIASTEEQRIRGNADRVADWILVATGYERKALDDVAREAAAVQQGARVDRHVLSLSMSAADLR